MPAPQGSGAAEFGVRESADGIEIRGISTAPDTLDPQDLQAYGFTWQNLSSGDLPETSTALITGLDPATQTANGWAPPQLSVTDLGNGLTERRITLGSGVELASVRDDDRRLLRVSEAHTDAGGTRIVDDYSVGGDGSRSLERHQESYTDEDGSRSVSTTDASGRTTVESFDVAGQRYGEVVYSSDGAGGQHTEQYRWREDGQRVLVRETTTRTSGVGQNITASSQTITYDTSGAELSRVETTDNRSNGSRISQTTERDSAGTLIRRVEVVYAGGGGTLDNPQPPETVVRSTVTERQSDGSQLSITRDGQGRVRPHKSIANNDQMTLGNGQKHCKNAYGRPCEARGCGKKRRVGGGRAGAGQRVGGKTQ